MRHLFPLLCLAGLLLLSPLAAGDHARSVNVTANFLPVAGSSSFSLVGLWSTTGYYGELVNSSGGFVTDNTSGEWYKFESNGHYVYTIITSGRVLAGIAQNAGTFSAKGTTINLHQKTESWYPFPKDPSHQKMYKNRPSVKESSLKVKVVKTNQIQLDGETFKRASK